MSIPDRLQDAAFLYSHDRRDGALLSVLIAVAATARRRYPIRISDRQAFTRFLAEEMVVVTGGAVRNYNVRVPSADRAKHANAMMPLGECFYEFVRCNLAHEAKLPDNVDFSRSEPGRLIVEITDTAIRLSDAFMDGLAKTVEYAPENQDLYPHVAEMPDDVIGWMLFGTRRDGLTDYVEARRQRVDRRLVKGIGVRLPDDK